MPEGLESKIHDQRLTLLSVSAGMVGVCLTGVGLIGVVKNIRDVESSVDETLTIGALTFLICTALYFVTLYHSDQSRRTIIDHVAGVLFFASLALLLLACVLFTTGF